MLSQPNLESIDRQRSSIFVVQDPGATDAFRPNPERIKPMVDRALLGMTGTRSLREAWRQFLSPEDVIGIKVLSAPGRTGGTRLEVVEAVIQTLLQAGVQPGRILIWDRRVAWLKLAGFDELATRYSVRLAGAVDAGFDDRTFYESSLIGTLIWGDHEFGEKGPGIGRKSFVTKLLTEQITAIINITPLLNHNLAGVYGNLIGLALGSVDNIGRFTGNPARLAVAVPELVALPAIGDRVVLNIVDALLCQYQGEQRGLLQYSVVLNQLRFSRDPVALDVFSMEELDRQRKAADLPDRNANHQLYENASLLEIGVSDLPSTRIIFLQ